MTDAAPMQLVISSIQLALNVAQALRTTKSASEREAEFVKLSAAITDAYRHAADAYSRETALSKRVGELEQEVMNLKDWGADKQRYELKQIGDGYFAYATKPGMEQGEPAHYLCQRCYQHGKKAILAFTGEYLDGRVHKCPEAGCGLKIAL